MRVTVVDSGMGNLHSVCKALRYVGAGVLVTDRGEDVESAEKLVLPGVGAFGKNVAALKTRGLWHAVRWYVERGLPFLGICVGMQLLMDESEEFGSHKGFGVIPGTCKRLIAAKVPHVGWDTLIEYQHGNSPAPLADAYGKAVYFVHSYGVLPKEDRDIAGFFRLDDGQHITAAVRRGNVWGTQFHPEKSGEVGLAILRRWVNE